MSVQFSALVIIDCSSSLYKKKVNASMEKASGNQKANFITIRHTLNNADWSELSTETAVDKSWKVFKNKFEEYHKIKSNLS